MRLSILLPELERGMTIQGGPKDRQLDLTVMANRREPVAIRPVTNHDRKVISAVLLTECIPHRNEVELKFRPIWCRLFTLCSSTKDKILALVIETENGKYWIDRGVPSYHPCNVTLSGNGTDPRVVEESQYLLGDLLLQDHRSNIILNLIEFLRQNC